MLLLVEGRKMTSGKGCPFSGPLLSIKVFPYFPTGTKKSSLLS